LVFPKEEGVRLAIEGGAHGFEMHKVRAAANFDVPLDWGGLEGIKQPARILVRDDAIPCTPNQGDIPSQQLKHRINKLNSSLSFVKMASFIVFNILLEQTN
jgi:hypothetical protein